MLRPMTRGDSRFLTLTVKDQDGDAANLTGALIVMTVKSYPSASTAVFSKSSEEPGEITIVNPTGGICEINVAPEDTEEAEPGTLWYDIEVTLADDSRWTVDKGEWKLERDYTTHEAP